MIFYPPNNLMVRINVIKCMPIWFWTVIHMGVVPHRCTHTYDWLTLVITLFWIISNKNKTNQ